jgi:ribose/xylose/arabinose/galactoside ABC-type transport system permease subunit
MNTAWTQRISLAGRRFFTNVCLPEGGTILGDNNRLTANADHGGKPEDSLLKRWLGKNEFVLLVILGLVFLLGVISVPKMLNAMNLFNLVRNTAFVGVVALASTLVILVGEFDISLGALVSLAVLVGGMTMQAGANSLVGILVTLLVGALLGLLNGFLIVIMKIPSLMATLGAMQLYSALNMMLNNNLVIYLYDHPAFSFLGQGNLFFIPVPAVIFLTIAGLLMFMLQKTKFGREFYFTGANERAAYLSGVATARVKLLAFVLSGFCAAFTGVYLAGQSNQIFTLIANQYSLSGICVAILGGVMIGGGKGTVMGTVIGALLFQLAINILTLSGLGTYVEMLLKGALLIIIVAAYQLLERVRAKMK